MGKVIAGFSMSLDGFVAARNDSPEPYVFDWYDAGDVSFDWPGNDMESHVTSASAAYLDDLVAQTGALVVGRRLFDFTDGWGGRHPVRVPVFVVSHRGPEGWDDRHDPSRTTFVSDGVARAVEQAQAEAGDKWVGRRRAEHRPAVPRPGPARRGPNRIELVPVILSDGIPLFANLTRTPVALDNPTVIEGDRVTHLIYAVQK